MPLERRHTQEVQQLCFLGFADGGRPFVHDAVGASARHVSDFGTAFNACHEPTAGTQKRGPCVGVCRRAVGPEADPVSSGKFSDKSTEYEASALW